MIVRAMRRSSSLASFSDRVLGSGRGGTKGGQEGKLGDGGLADTPRVMNN